MFSLPTLPLYDNSPRMRSFTTASPRSSSMRLFVTTLSTVNNTLLSTPRSRSSSSQWSNTSGKQSSGINKNNTSQILFNLPSWVTMDIDYDIEQDKSIFITDCIEESQRILKIYADLTSIEGFKFNWQSTVSKDNVVVYNSEVPGCVFKAVKSESFINNTRDNIVNYMMNLDNLMNYDELLEGCEVSEHHLNFMCNHL